MTLAMKSVVADPTAYDWEGDTPLRRPYSQTVIDEMHVGGFTKDPSSGVTPGTGGTYAGLIEKIPYLKDLGITAVELLPVVLPSPDDIRLWDEAPTITSTTYMVQRRSVALLAVAFHAPGTQD
jgi:pullulanase/glycogen debranching enzyme